MPIYEYQVGEGQPGCAQCGKGWEEFQAVSAAPLTQCPCCGAPVRRLISAPAVGLSRTGLDHRAKAAGFHKLKRLGHGEYEKNY